MTAQRLSVDDENVAREALDAAPFGVALLDTDLRVRWANRTFASLSARGRDELADLPLDAALPALRGEAVGRARQLVDTIGPTEDLALAMRAPLPRTRPWRVVISVVRDEAGAARGAACWCVEAGEDAVLEDLVLQTQKFEAVGLLANLIAHDFNNLLSVIQGYSDLMARGTSDAARTLARVNAIRDAATAAAHLSRQLLALSRHNTGSTAEVDVNLLVRTASALLARVLPANITLELELAEDLGLTSADPGQLEQVLMSLITNAIDAMPGGGRLGIATANAEQASRGTAGPLEGRFVSFTVSDTGIGMDAATQARVFEPLFTTKRAPRASGLGLSSVHRIVTALGGSIRVTSGLGSGSAFTVLLPRAAGDETPAGDMVAAAGAVGGATILLVEDHESLRQVLLTAMEEAGYRVLAARSCAEARQLAAPADAAIEMLVADIELPDGDGIALLSQLRQSRPQLRALISTGFAERAPAPEDAAAGQFTIIRKPYGMTQLLAAMAATRPADTTDPSTSTTRPRN